MSDNIKHDGDGHFVDNPTAGNWERETLEKLVFATIKERRAARRWSIFFRLAFLTVIVVGLWTYFDLSFGSDDENLGRHTALIEINGEIEAEGSGAADNVIPSLNKAFADAGSAAVVLRIDSPGGSPVQAGIIVDEIRRLKRGYPDKPLYVVVDEICASGGYYIAAAADRIYVNKASIVGSVGVLMDSFGFTGTMEKLGVERRLLTAGANKGFLDPFSPQSDKHRAHAQEMLNEIHQQFITVVRAGRGTRLKETPDMFSGLYWTGAKAVDMGLADGFGTVDTVARDIVKAEDIVDYTAHEGLPERVLKKFGASVGEGALKAMSHTTLPKLN
ncbi:MULTISPECIES: S49 family peptidase [unclassified Massilia]|uniref:S49 family peptidase n=1 Tax=unclassified Massilia TaxID=2609279 RepID=UPI0017861FFA|nr:MULTISPECIES: S49 family peptidase [unclassified Massilia]MBD8528752.1 S49 family peptidase [Massilia sp. CFBP 13647]MBD8672356.1 S49 family peptidase [Massilia sp. CFBP 13721]